MHHVLDLAFHIYFHKLITYNFILCVQYDFLLTFILKYNFSSGKNIRFPNVNKVILSSSTSVKVYFHRKVIQRLALKILRASSQSSQELIKAKC